MYNPLIGHGSSGAKLPGTNKYVVPSFASHRKLTFNVVIMQNSASPDYERCGATPRAAYTYAEMTVMKKDEERDVTSRLLRSSSR